MFRTGSESTRRWRRGYGAAGVMAFLSLTLEVQAQPSVVPPPPTRPQIVTPSGAIPERRSAILPLRYRSTTELQVDLNVLQGSGTRIGSGVAGVRTGTGGSPRTRRVERDALPVGDEMRAGDLRLRLVRILENDVKNDFDDEVVVLVTTGKQPEQELKIRELRIVDFEGYEIRVLSVVPSSGKPGGGDAKIQIRPPDGSR